MAQDRLRGALWGLFAGDALASPTHWYYGGAAQIEADWPSGHSVGRGVHPRTSGMAWPMTTPCPHKSPSTLDQSEQARMQGQSPQG